MTIRHMTEADLPQVLRIEQENFSIPWSENSFRAMLGRPEAVFLVASEEKPEGREEPVGYAGLVAAGGEADVTNIAVRETCKRRGIGRQLLEGLLEEAKGRGASAVFLEVREHNVPAIALYEKAGFLPVGRRKEYYTDTKEDAILMKWSAMEKETTAK